MQYIATAALFDRPLQAGALPLDSRFLKHNDIAQ